MPGRSARCSMGRVCSPPPARSRTRATSLDGPGEKDQGIRWKDSANIIPTDANGLAFSRSTGEVLNIVYLGGAGSGFGFFPNRLNGAIK